MSVSESSPDEVAPADWRASLRESGLGDVAAEVGPDAPSEVHTVVLELIGEETGQEPESLIPDLQLEKDLELSGLALWSVVAQIERELHVSFPDRQVEKWRTLADILVAATSSQGTADTI